MTVQSTYKITEYATNGVGPYLFEWVVSKDSHVLVAIDNALLVENVDFTVALNPSAPGGSITLLSDPTPNLQLLIARRTELNQTLDLAAYTRFPSEANEEALDKLTLISQEQENRINDLADALSKPVYSNVVGGVFVTPAP